MNLSKTITKSSLYIAILIAMVMSTMTTGVFAQGQTKSSVCHLND